MKKRTIIALTAAFIFGLVSYSYAKYVSGFTVVDVADKQVTIQKGEEAPVMVNVKKAGKYNVGDKVKFDAGKMKVRKAKPKADYEMGC